MTLAAILSLLVIPAGCSDDSPPGEGKIAPVLPDGCRADECVIDGTCFSNLDTSPETSCRVCVVAVDRTRWTSVDLGPCDDGDLCTSDDRCVDEVCAGTVVDCADDDKCTVDSCDADTGDCLNQATEGTCDDGDVCTGDDVCSGGLCAGQPLDCEDGEACTSNYCVPDEGCTSIALGTGACDDANACTSNDGCVEGVCTGGDTLDCDDGDVCTVDACDPEKGCIYAQVGSACDDGDECTDDVCDAQIGCVNTFNTAPCDDNNACTEADACSEGACVGGIIPIDDGNPCTDDSCDEVTGVANTPNEAACDDGDACTVGDICKDAACVTGTDVLECDDNSVCTTDSCEPSTGCVNEVTLTCTDDQPCTEDVCDPKEGCVFPVILANDCRPQIVVTTPPRGATLGGADDADTAIPVAGTVTSGAGDITTFTLNGVPVEVGADGAFSTTVTAKTGGQTLVFEAEDTLGAVRKRVQAFHFATDYVKAEFGAKPGAVVDPGMALFLSSKIYDTLEQVFAGSLGGFDIAGFIPSPVTEEPVNADAGLGDVSYMIYLAGCPADSGDCCAGGKCYDFFTYDAPTIDLVGADGGFEITMVIANIQAGIWGQRTDCSWLGCVAPNPLVGTMSISDITVKAKIGLSVNADNGLDAAVSDTSASFGDVNVDIDHWTAFIIEGIINDQIGSLLGDVQEQFAGELDGTIGPLITDAFGALALEAEFPLPALIPGGPEPTLVLKTDFAAVDASVDGMFFTLRAMATALGEGLGKSPYDTPEHLGIPIRANCGAGGAVTVPLTEKSPLEIVLGDDAMNLLLYTAWQTGFLELIAPQELLSEVDLTSLGVSDVTVKLGGMLPPTVSDCNEEAQTRLHIGDLKVDVSMNVLGSPLDAEVFVSLESGFSFSVSDAGLGFGLTDVLAFDVEVNVKQEALLGFESIISDLVQTELLPGLLESLTAGTCEPTAGACEPACGEGAACAVTEAGPQCVCQTGNTLVGDACTPEPDAVCEPGCNGNATCLTGDEGSYCVCKVGQTGADCQDCEPGYSSLGGLGAFPLPPVALGDGPPLVIQPESSEHINGFTLILGDIQ